VYRGNALEKHRFRPMYAEANMGHRSRTINRGYEMKSARFPRPNDLYKNGWAKFSRAFRLETFFPSSPIADFLAALSAPDYGTAHHNIS